MKNISLLFILLTMALHANCQDLILTIGSKITAVKGKDLNISGGNVMFSDIEINKRYSYPMWSIMEISFNQNNELDIKLLKMTIDTIRCQIVSFGNELINYNLPNDSTPLWIEKGKVFAVLFEKSIVLREIENYIPIFFGKHSLEKMGKMRIIKADGTEKEISKPINATTTQISYSQKAMGSNSITIEALSGIKRWVHYDSIQIKSPKALTSFLVNLSGIFTQGLVGKIGKDEFVFSINTGSNIRTWKQSKGEVSSVMFYNYPKQRNKAGTNMFVASDISSGIVPIGKTYAAALSFSGGFGYRLAEVPSSYSRELKEFYEGMKMGAVFEASLSFLSNENFGFVLKYNRFFAQHSGQLKQSSILFDASERMAINYFGIGLNFSTPINQDRGFYFVHLTGGYVSIRNKATVSAGGQSESATATGESYGFNISQGFNFEVANNVYLGLQLGISLGKIKEMKVEGQSREVKTNEGLARIEGLTGLRFYF